MALTPLIVELLGTLKYIKYIKRHYTCSGPRPYSPDKGPANLGCYPEADYDLDLELLVVYFSSSVKSRPQGLQP